MAADLRHNGCWGLNVAHYGFRLGQNDGDWGEEGKRHHPGFVRSAGVCRQPFWGSVPTVYLRVQTSIYHSVLCRGGSLSVYTICHQPDPGRWGDSGLPE